MRKTLYPAIVALVISTAIVLGQSNPDEVDPDLLKHATAKLATKPTAKPKTTSKPTTAPGDKPDPKIISHVSDIFSGSPPETIPDPKVGWTDFDLPKMMLWIRKEKGRHPIDIKFKAGIFSVTRIGKENDKIITDHWEVGFTIPEEKIEIGKMVHMVTIYDERLPNNFVRNTPKAANFFVKTDEAGARRATKAKEAHQGQNIEVKGEISGITIEETVKRTRPPGPAQKNSKPTEFIGEARITIGNAEVAAQFLAPLPDK